MKYITYLIVGIVFGITLTKAEVISWFRIQEMFRFQAFHMYGVIGTAVVLGALFVAAVKKFKLKDFSHQPIQFKNQPKSVARFILGGTIFGIGWAFTGACPGPIYILLGNGLGIYIVVLISALAGTLTYGMLRSKLPH